MKRRLKRLLSILLIIMIVVIMPIGLFNIVFPFSYKQEIQKYSQLYDLDESLVASVIFVESRFNEKAQSSKGALGLMQIIPSTGLAFSENSDEFISEDLYNPDINIKIGCKFLRYLFNKYDDEITVLACYNAGEGVVRSWMGESCILKFEQIKYEETSKYVNKVLESRKIYMLRFI